MSAAVAAKTRESIVENALQLGSLEGLESLSFGRVAEDLPLSKSGVIRHFASKEELQLAALDAGRRRFQAAIWDPSADEPPGLPRLRAVMRRWLDYLQRCPLPGGCLITAAAVEFDSKPGTVRDTVRADGALWTRLLERDVEVAVRAGELPGDTDPAQVAFELGGIALAVNQGAQLHGDSQAAGRGGAAVERLLSPDLR